MNCVLLPLSGGQKPEQAIGTLIDRLFSQRETTKRVLYGFGGCSPQATYPV
jgi:hypothetical protein